MEIIGAKLVYAPFKKFPSGHLFVVFTFADGKQVGVSPEADIRNRGPFSLIRGLGKTYFLRYLIEHPDYFADYFRKNGRAMREFPLELSQEKLNALYRNMLRRKEVLEKEAEWYNTLHNSCVTNVIGHLKELQVIKSFALSYGLFIFAPARIAKL